MAQTDLIIGTRLDADSGKVRGSRCVCPYCNGVFELNGNTSGPAANQMSCKRCGFEWESRKGDPMKCPRCGSYSWNKVAIRCKCMVCGHGWRSRRPEGPSRCPSCNSNRWNEPVRQVDAKIVEEDPAVVRDRWILERYNNGSGCLAISSELGLPLMKVMKVVSSELGLGVTPRI